MDQFIRELALSQASSLELSHSGVGSVVVVQSLILQQGSSLET